MKKIICMLLVLSSVSVFSQKEFKVVNFKQSSSDISARTNQREDPKGIACALVKVQIPMRDILFDGDVIGEVSHKVNEYWVYMPDKSTKLLIRKAGFSPLNVDFKNYNVPILESKGTYELCLLEKQAEAPQLYNDGMIALAKNDMITAFDKLQSAADAGYGMANYQLGSMQVQPYEVPEGYEWIEDPNTAETYQAAYDYYKKAADAGVPEALFALGEFIQKYNDTKSMVAKYPEDAKMEPNIYEINIPKNLCEPNKALGMIREAANKGVVEAQYMMLGDDQWCKENANKGNAVAQFGMGLRNDSELSYEEYWMLESAEVSSSENFGEAVEWYKKAAENGLDAAQWRLGEMYARGLGVAQDINKAIELRTKAAEQGNTMFQFMMSVMYATGGFADYATYSYPDGEVYNVEIPLDVEKADKWLRRVNHKQLNKTEKDRLEGNGLLSFTINQLSDGFMKQSKYDKVIYWYQRQAEMGYRDAFCKLGEMYLEGEIVNKDNQKARDLFEKAILDDEHYGDGYSGYLRDRAKAFLGVIYRDGLGVESNQMKAKAFLAESADKNDAKGMYELAILFEKEGNSEAASKLFNELKNGWGQNDNDDYYKNKAKERLGNQ
jgi:TPR repeat protein